MDNNELSKYTQEQLTQELLNRATTKLKKRTDLNVITTVRVLPHSRFYLVIVDNDGKIVKDVVGDESCAITVDFN